MPTRRDLERSHVQLSFALAVMEEVLRRYELLDTPIHYIGSSTNTSPRAVIDTAFDMAAPINDVLDVDHVRR